MHAVLQAESRKGECPRPRFIAFGAFLCLSGHWSPQSREICRWQRSQPICPPSWTLASHWAPPCYRVYMGVCARGSLVFLRTRHRATNWAKRRKTNDLYVSIFIGFWQIRVEVVSWLVGCTTLSDKASCRGRVTDGGPHDFLFVAERRTRRMNWKFVEKREERPSRKLRPRMDYRTFQLLTLHGTCSGQPCRDGNVAEDWSFGGLRWRCHTRRRN